MQGRGKPEDNMLKTKLSLSRREFGLMMGATGLAYGVGRNFVSSAL
jgi:sugar phosphate permease